ncbi:transposase [Microcystis aeruginosa NIES-3807]|uniref:Transposase n=3 Tax=Microcystis TaxID=1125 RepID=A0AAD3AXN6_MICAE|nr:transposase [Microcystis aeruginosa NIES-3807]
MVGTFSGKKSLKALSNKVFRFIQQTLIRQEFPDLAAKYFDNKPYFWAGAYFVASCGDVTVEQLKKYVENQNSPKVERLLR